MTQRSGFLAGRAGYFLALQVLSSAAGFYLGTCDQGGPVSRESVEYFPTISAAEAALASGDFTQRTSP
jgi:hypothetical protein